MNSRLLLGVSLLVALLLVIGMFHPAVFGQPYEPRSESPSYHIAHESTEDFAAEVTEGYSGELTEYTGDPTPLEAFDAEQQRLFETVYDAQSTEVYDSPPERQEYTTTVCKDWMRACDASESIPTFPADASYSTGSKSHVELSFVDYNSETYVVVEHHSSGGFHGLFSLALRFGLFGPLALAIVGIAVAGRKTDQRTVLALTGYGVGIGALGVVTPYLKMLSGVGVLTYATELVVLTWGVIAVTVVYLLRSEPSPADSKFTGSETGSDAEHGETQSRFRK